MGATCALCDKRRRVGNKVSHANNKSKRLFLPNLQRVRAIINNATRYIRVCTACIRSGYITKPLH